MLEETLSCSLLEILCSNLDDNLVAE